MTAPVVPVLADVTGECSATATTATTTDNCSGTITGTTTDDLTYTQHRALTLSPGHSMMVTATHPQQHRM